MIDFSSVVVTTLTGMVGVIIGAIVSNYVNQRIAREATKKDIVLRKKIEYFEKIVDTLGHNTQMYRKFIKKAEKTVSKKEAAEILAELKRGRKKFEIMAGPLYMDTRPVSVKIKQFTDIEKNIFSNFEKLSRPEYPKEDVIHGLKISFADIERAGNNLICGFRANLLKE